MEYTWLRRQGTHARRHPKLLICIFLHSSEKEFWNCTYHNSHTAQQWPLKKQHNFFQTQRTRAKIWNTMFTSAIRTLAILHKLERCNRYWIICILNGTDYFLEELVIHKYICKHKIQVLIFLTYIYLAIVNIIELGCNIMRGTEYFVPL